MFKTIKTILFATDLSPNCRSAFEAAISLAAQYQAKLVLLHIISNRNVPRSSKGTSGPPWAMRNGKRWPRSTSKMPATP
jgi:nucleotide-binding universal stress UspA family protein